jgi:hypothetical protein
LEKFTKIHCVSQEKYHISYVHNTHTHAFIEIKNIISTHNKVSQIWVGKKNMMSTQNIIW